MSDQDTLPPKETKFFFDKIHFDEPEEDEIEEEVPPPPTFSEEELSEARRVSYERGKADGIAEAHKSFEKQTEALLEIIARDLQTLFTNEGERAKLYEAEAVRLADTIFKKLFPVLNEKHGLAEITNVINKVIDSQSETHEIQLFVAPDFKDKVQEHINTNAHINGLNGKIDVVGDETLEAGDCRLRWKDGGGLRDISTLSSQIAKEIEVLLADAPVNKDNSKSKASVSSDSDEMASAQIDKKLNEPEIQDQTAQDARDGDE